MPPRLQIILFPAPLIFRLNDFNHLRAHPLFRKTSIIPELGLAEATALTGIAELLVEAAGMEPASGSALAGGPSPSRNRKRPVKTCHFRFLRIWFSEPTAAHISAPATGPQRTKLKPDAMCSLPHRTPETARRVLQKDALS